MSYRVVWETEFSDDCNGFGIMKDTYEDACNSLSTLRDFAKYLTMNPDNFYIEALIKTDDSKVYIWKPLKD